MQLSSVFHYTVALYHVFSGLVVFVVIKTVFAVVQIYICSLMLTQLFLRFRSVQEAALHPPSKQSAYFTGVTVCDWAQCAFARGKTPHK